MYSEMRMMDEQFEDLSKLSKDDIDVLKTTWDDFTYIDGMTLHDIFYFGGGCGRALEINKTLLK